VMCCCCVQLGRDLGRGRCGQLVMDTVHLTHLADAGARMLHSCTVPVVESFRQITAGASYPVAMPKQIATALAHSRTRQHVNITSAR
jgi:hypothetical protein